MGSLIERNLFLKISAFNGHMEAWKFLHINRSIRLLFIHHFPEIVQYFIHLKKLPKWCYLVFPVDFFKIVHPFPLSPTQLLSGSAVCQIVFQKTWPEADIDIFEHCEEESRRKKQKVDLIFKNEKDGIQNVLCSFDLSICQIGILNRVVYVTPLFLYTYKYHKVLATVTDVRAKYKHEYNSGETNLDSFFRSHNILHNPYIFGSCAYCTTRLEDLEDNSLIERWLLRLDKYRKRFPDFEFLFFEDG